MSSNTSAALFWLAYLSPALALVAGEFLYVAIRQTIADIRTANAHHRATLRETP